MRNRRVIAFVLMLSMLLAFLPNSTPVHAAESGVESFSFDCHNKTGYLRTGYIENEEGLESDILSYSFEPYGTSESVTMVSSNTDVATLEYDEEIDRWIIYYHALGTTVITATTESGLVDFCTVTVTTVDEVYLEEPFTVTVHPGDIQMFIFAPEEEGYYSIYSEDKTVLLNADNIGRPFFGNGVDTQYLGGSNPFIMAVWNNTATVGTYTVCVKKSVPIEKLIFEYDSYSGYPGEREVIRISSYPAWSIPEEPVFTSSDENVVYYDPPGSRWVTFANPGTATITATVENGVTAQCTVTVHGTEEIAPGESKTITLDNRDEKRYSFTPETDGKYVIYMLRGEHVITGEDENGFLVGYPKEFMFSILQNGEYLAGDKYAADYLYAVCDMAAGQTYTLCVSNTWSSSDAITGTIHFDKVEDPSSFSVMDNTGASNGVAYTGQSFMLYTKPADGLPFLAGDIAWSVEDETVVAMEYAQGDLASFYTVGVGSTKITATLGSGVSAVFEVEVLNAELSLGDVVPVQGAELPDFTFTPEKDGYYAVYADVTEDIDVYIYSPDYSLYQYKQIPANSGEGLSVKLTAGVTYTISTYIGNAEGRIWIGEGVYAASMEITKLPEMMTYVEGQVASGLNLKGMEMTITWSDGTVTKHVTETAYCEIDGARITTEADEVNGLVTLRYGEAEASFNVELIPNPVAAISIFNADDIPGLLENAYYQDWAGYQSHVITRKVQLLIEYTDGTTEIIGADDSVAGYPVRSSSRLSGPDGTNTVTFSLLGQSVTYEAGFVENPVASIELVSGPEPFVMGRDSQVIRSETGKLSFVADWGCRYEGLVIKINYVDGTSEEVSFADLVFPESDNDFYKLPEYKDYPVEAMLYLPEYGSEFSYWTGSRVSDENGQVAMILHYMGSYLHFNVTLQDSDAIGGTCGENLTWELSEDGILTISGTGDMYDYAAPVDPAGITVMSAGNPAPWYAMRSDIRQIVIGENVTSIGANAFADCDAVEAVTIPAGVAKIGQKAFSGCTGLSEIVFEGDAPEIGDSAFSSVEAEVTYPEDNDTWTEEVFENYGGDLDWNAPAGMKGDLDLDGDVDSDDLTLLARHVGGIQLVEGQALVNSDVNSDGEVNSDDLTKHARYVGGIITEWDQE